MNIILILQKGHDIGRIKGLCLNSDPESKMVETNNIKY